MPRRGLTLVAIAAAAATGTANAELIGFDEFVHGSIVTELSTVSSDGMVIGVNALNPNRRHNIAAIFDSRQVGTADDDLEDPWSGGNIPASTILGNILIISENDFDQNNDGILDDPDDEGSRAAGSLSLDFGVNLNEFGMDLIDVENTMSENGSLEFFLGGASVGELTFAAIGAMDASVLFGNNSANTLPTITADALGSVFDAVTVHMGGSGAIDNVRFQAVPAPGAAVVLLAGIAGGRRRRRG